MSQLKTPTLAPETDRERQIWDQAHEQGWDQGHEQGWNDCLHEWNEQDKLPNAGRVTAVKSFGRTELASWALHLTILAGLIYCAAIHLWPYLPSVAY